MTESELALRLVRLKREQRKVVPKPSSAASKENSKSGNEPLQPFNGEMASPASLKL